MENHPSPPTHPGLQVGVTRGCSRVLDKSFGVAEVKGAGAGEESD